jgi:glycosyltransferase involved in cell wall biosynthesis
MDDICFMELSIIITLFNEEENISPLLHQLKTALSSIMYEIILVDDGSSDDTVSRIKALADKHVKLICLTKNYGQTPAMAAGIDLARGRYIVTMDGDLQNDPLDIPVLLKKLKDENWDVVAGYRKNRKDKALLRKVPSKIANYFIRQLSGVHIRDYGCSLKVFKSAIAKNLDLYGELHRFIPILAVLQGARITDMEVNHRPRIHGVSKYGLGRTLKVMSDLLLMSFFQKYFRRPIHFFGPLGFIAFFTGMIINIYLLIVKLIGEDIWGRPLLLLGVSLTLAGIQFLTFGFMAELMMRIYYESQNKKTYLVKEIFTGKSEPKINSTDWVAQV